VGEEVASRGKSVVVSESQRDGQLVCIEAISDRPLIAWDYKVWI
jgi:hypothetical protein